MIDEERVRELYHMAVYDAHRGRTDVQAEEYFAWDYVSKELLKSIFSGSIAFFMIVVLWGMSNPEQITEMINNLDFLNIGARIIALYIGFMALYLFLTVLVYAVRYKNGRKRLNKYEGHMKKVRKMYQREERLKL